MTPRMIRTTGADLIVDEAGRDEPAFVFLHYWGGSARTWDASVSCLPASRRTIVVNQRGWGGSTTRDGRYDLEALADDIMEVLETLGVARYVAVGHSMGGKVAQVLAGRRPQRLVGLVLVAPAPPSPMPVPQEIRAGMLVSYQSRDGVLQALEVLAGSMLQAAQREQVIRDTLGGTPEAKRYWPEHGMSADIGAALAQLDLPVEIVLAEGDRVERLDVLKPLFARILPRATITTLPEVGHLLPLEAPEAVASICERMIARIG